jgi:hypothetical protein
MKSVESHQPYICTYRSVGTVSPYKDGLFSRRSGLDFRQKEDYSLLHSRQSVKSGGVLPPLPIHHHAYCLIEHKDKPALPNLQIRNIFEFTTGLGIPGPLLWSSGQSSWLLIQRFRARFSALPNFVSSSGCGTGSTQQT